MCCIATYNYTYIIISRNIVNNNDAFNERTDTLLYKNIPLILYLKGMRKGGCWLCVRGELESGTDCYILTQSSSDYSSTSFASGLGCSTVGQSESWFSRWHLVSNWLQLQLELNSDWLTQAVCGTWLYNCLTSTCVLWAYASAPNSTTSTGQGDILISSTGCTCFAVLLIFTGASTDWRLGRGSICHTWYLISTSLWWCRTNQQKLCTDTGCCLEDLPEAMDDTDGWPERERVEENRV